jgi:hypothetical protein
VNIAKLPGVPIKRQG